MPGRNSPGQRAREILPRGFPIDKKPIPRCTAKWSWTASPPPLMERKQGENDGGLRREGKAATVRGGNGTRETAGERDCTDKLRWAG